MDDKTEWCTMFGDFSREDVWPSHTVGIHLKSSYVGRQIYRESRKSNGRFVGHLRLKTMSTVEHGLKTIQIELRFLLMPISTTRKACKHHLIHYLQGRGHRKVSWTHFKVPIWLFDPALWDQNNHRKTRVRRHDVKFDNAFVSWNMFFSWKSFSSALALVQPLTCT